MARFSIKMTRKWHKYTYIYFFPAGLFVAVSSVSFRIPPTAYPARCGLLTLTLLVLVNLFISALWTTPSDSIGLTALAAWILACIIFVFIALIFYVVILLKIRADNYKVSSIEDKKSNLNLRNTKKSPIDLDIFFLIVHLASFGLFIITYCFVYAA